MFESKRHALAYLMGVYLSDGSVDTQYGRFQVGPRDVEFRDTVAHAMELVGAKFSLHEFEPHPDSHGKKRVYRLRERSPYHVGWWLETWFPEGKDHLPFIADELARDLVAGILDGDGSIWLSRPGQYQFKVCGFSKYLANLQVLFTRLGVKMHYRPLCINHYINLKSFVEARFYFRLPRKQALVDAYAGK